MIKKAILTASFVFITAGASFAAGAHDGMQCTGCHSLHNAKGALIAEVAPNTKALPDGASRSAKSVSAFCLGCHADADKGGMGILPISAHTTHPFGSRVNKKVANVPDGLLRDGVMECVSCHDPHPSNANYKYLRVDTKGGKQMAAFCDLCHPAKVDKSVSRDSLRVFDSMDEVSGAKTSAVSDLAGAKPAAAPEKK